MPKRLIKRNSDRRGSIKPGQLAADIDADDGITIRQLSIGSADFSDECCRAVGTTIRL